MKKFVPAEDPMQDIDECLIRAGFPHGPLLERVLVALRIYIIGRDRHMFMAGVEAGRKQTSIVSLKPLATEDQVWLIRGSLPADSDRGVAL